MNRPAADAAAPVEVDKDDEEAVEVEENDYEDDEEDEDEEHEEDDEDFDDDDEDVEEDEVDALFGNALGCVGGLWGSFGHPLRTLWRRLGGPWGVASLLGRFWGGFWDHFGTMLAPFWVRFLSENRPSFLDRCWSRFGSHFS